MASQKPIMRVLDCNLDTAVARFREFWEQHECLNQLELHRVDVARMWPTFVVIEVLTDSGGMVHQEGRARVWFERRGWDDQGCVIAVTDRGKLGWSRFYPLALPGISEEAINSIPDQFALYLERRDIIQPTTEPETGGGFVTAEQGRELVYTGSLEHFQALLATEATFSKEPTSRQSKRICLTLYGPIEVGASLCWLVSNGTNMALEGHRQGKKGISVGAGRQQLALPPEMTLDEIAVNASRTGLDMCRLLRVGQVCAAGLPQDRIRVLFAVRGFQESSIFWKWVDGVTGEMKRLGFVEAEQLVLSGDDTAIGGTATFQVTSVGRKGELVTEIDGVEMDLPSFHKFITEWLLPMPGEDRMMLKTKVIEMTEKAACWEVSQIFEHTSFLNNWGDEVGYESLSSSLGYVTALQGRNQLSLRFYRPEWDFPREERCEVDADSGFPFRLPATTHTRGTELLTLAVIEGLQRIGVLPKRTSYGEDGVDIRLGGRPRAEHYDWAYQQVEEFGRELAEVYPEWLERIGDHAHDLVDPLDSLKQAIRYRRKKGKKGE